MGFLQRFTGRFRLCKELAIRLDSFLKKAQCRTPPFALLGEKPLRVRRGLAQSVAQVHSTDGAQNLRSNRCHRASVRALMFPRSEVLVPSQARQEAQGRVSQSSCRRCEQLGACFVIALFNTSSLLHRFKFGPRSVFKRLKCVCFIDVCEIPAACVAVFENLENFDPNVAPRKFRRWTSTSPDCAC